MMGYRSLLMAVCGVLLAGLVSAPAQAAMPQIMDEAEQKALLLPLPQLQELSSMRLKETGAACGGTASYQVCSRGVTPTKYTRTPVPRSTSVRSFDARDQAIAMMQISMKPLDEANGGKHILVKRTPTEMIHVVEHDKPTRKRPNTVNSYKWDGDLLVVDGHCSFIGKYRVKELVACANAIRDAQAAAAFI